MRQQIQARKLIKNSNVYLCGKWELIVFPRAYIMMEPVRKPFIVCTNVQRTINTDTLVSYLILACGNDHYISLAVQI